MDDSRRIWAAAGLLGVLVASALSILRLAQSEYRLVVHVTDGDGPLGGVWVAVGEKQILTTNSSGYAAVRGGRYELSSSVVTVTDSQLEGRHLSQTVIPEVSWNPFQSESVLEIRLPVVDSAMFPFELTQLESDLSAEGELNESAYAKREMADASNSKIEEVELADNNKPHFVSLKNYSLLRSRIGSENDDGGELFCRFAGLSTYFCNGQSAQAEFRMVEDAIHYQENPQAELVISQVGSREHSTVVKQTKLNESLPESVYQKQTEVHTSGVSISIYLEGNPLSGATVYMSRQKDSRVIPLGKTSHSGILSTRILPAFMGEKFTVVHACCAPKSFSTKLLRKDGETYKANLEKGTGFGVLVQQSAYGFLRGNAVFELHSDDLKLSVSGQDGLAFYDSGKLPETRLERVLIRNGLPSEYFLDSENNQNQLTHVLMAANEPFLPTLAVVESEGDQFHRGVLKSGYLRRWRRDFMARLMQLQTVRTQVSGESEARLRLAQESLTRLRSSGWKQTLLASEWDFVLSIDYNDNGDALEFVLSDRSGNKLMRRSVRAQDSIPERVAREQFSEMVKIFPFEGYVLSESGGDLELSFTEQKSYGLIAGSKLALYSHELIDSTQLKTELIGLAEVKNGESEGMVKARVTHMSRSSSSTSPFPVIVRVVKVAQDFYKAELRKNSFAVFEKDSL